MKTRDQTALVLLLIGGYLYAKGAARVRAAANVPGAAADAARKFGATIYDAVRDDRHDDLPGPQFTREALLAIAQNAGFPDPKLAAAIALAESGGVVHAIRRSARENSVGLWQINTLVQPYSVANMRDPLKNARAAFEISKGGTNWRPWTTFTNGRYRQYQTGILAP